MSKRATKKAPTRVPAHRVHVRRPAAASAKLLTVPQAAECIGMSEITLWHWIGARRIEVVRINRSVRIPRSVIDNIIERGTVPADRRVAVA